MSPLWSHFQHERYPLPYEDWMAFDLECLPLCHAALRLPGDSPGADRETMVARSLGIPVYGSIAELLASEPTTRGK